MRILRPFESKKVKENLMRLFIQPHSNTAVLRPETGNIKARLNFIIQDLSSRQKLIKKKPQKYYCAESALDLLLSLLCQSLTEPKKSFISFISFL